MSPSLQSLIGRDTKPFDEDELFDLQPARSAWPPIYPLTTRSKAAMGYEPAKTPLRRRTAAGSEGPAFLSNVMKTPSLSSLKARQVCVGPVWDARACEAARRGLAEV